MCVCDMAMVMALNLGGVVRCGAMWRRLSCVCVCNMAAFMTPKCVCVCGLWCLYVCVVCDVIVYV